jgi:hypothetical protein
MLDTDALVKALGNLNDAITNVIGTLNNSHESTTISTGYTSTIIPFEDYLAEQLTTDIRTLRKELVDLGYNKDEIRTEKDKTILIKALYAERFPDTSGEDTLEESDEIVAEALNEVELDDSAEDTDGEPDELTRDAAEHMALPELKSVAKSIGWLDDDLQGLDVEGVVSLLFDRNDEDADTTDDLADYEEEMAEEEAEEAETESGGYTPEELQLMRIPALKEILDAWELTYPANAPAPALRSLILKAQTG